jgi:hypothetical protein
MYNFASEFDIIQEHTGLPEDDAGTLRANNERRACLFGPFSATTRRGAAIEERTPKGGRPRGHGRGRAPRQIAIERLPTSRRGTEPVRVPRRSADRPLVSLAICFDAQGRPAWTGSG